MDDKFKAIAELALTKYFDDHNLHDVDSSFKKIVIECAKISAEITALMLQELNSQSPQDLRQ